MSGGQASLPLVEFHNVELAYRLSRNRTTSFKEFAIHLFKRQVTFEEHWALRGVTLAVEAGQVLAVVGGNGAGKSTLLKLAARVLPPTLGRVVVRGTVAPLIELGAGFNHELTGTENAVLYGTLLGRRPQDVRRRVSQIAEWAELTSFMDVPVRSYSSGMLARLAFAVAVDVEPDVLLVDEVLSVGDESFQHKSNERLSELIESGAAVVLVSHDLEAVLSLAHRAVWLDRGSVRAAGTPSEVIDRYRASVLPETLVTQCVAPPNE